MSPICGVCHHAESKYRCPNCDLRYCSLSCYKPHKTDHELNGTIKTAGASEPALAPRKVDRPGTTQRVAKQTFTDFEKDPDFQRLLTQFPLLKAQLQLVYGVTLEPGPTDARSWSRQDWYAGPAAGEQSSFSGPRGRGRGRGRSFGRGRGEASYRTGRPYGEKAPEDVQHGPWTQEKGDKEGLDMIHKMRESSQALHAEGISEFVQLCQLKYGEQ